MASLTGAGGAPYQPVVIVSLGGKGRFRGRFGGTRTLNRAAGMRCSASVRVAVPAVLRHAERSYFYHGLLWARWR